MEVEYVIGWVLLAVVVIAAVIIIIHQIRTGKQPLNPRVIEDITAVVSAALQAMADGKISKEELRIIIERALIVLADLTGKSIEETAAEIPGASEQILYLGIGTTADLSEVPVVDNQQGGTDAEPATVPEDKKQ